MRTALLTTLAMVAFAANSILCRAALGGATIDAASFSTVRLVSGAVSLALLHAAISGSGSLRGGSWRSAAMLFLYAVPFSFAYNSLTAGTGALILFGAVQATMILTALRSGERPHRLEWVGRFAALTGLVYLVLPGLSAPSPAGTAVMAVAGLGGGGQCVLGRRGIGPVAR